MAKVLLIDDEAIIRRIVRVVLEAEGHTVLEASDASEGIEVLQANRPDVVVLDLMMPGEYGTDVCRKIKALDQRTKVIVLTSLPAADAKDLADEAGADDYMEKPFSSLDLLERLARLEPM